jgi:hypothetical protein
MQFSLISVDKNYYYEFLDDFPSVSKDAALAVLEMAKKSLTTEKLLLENFV